MNWQQKIVMDPAVLAGKPVIKGTRLSVEFIIGLLSQGWDFQEILKNYPQLTKEDIQAALHYASEVLKAEVIFPTHTGTTG